MSQQHNPDIIGMTVKACILRMKNNGQLLNEFLSDMELGKHKDWKVYQYELAKIMSKLSHGHLKRIRSRPAVGEPGKLTMFARTLADKNRIWIPRLQLYKCRNNKEKIKMIMSSECSPEIKADLVSEVLG